MIRDQKNLKIDADLHRRIKILAAKKGMLTFRLAEELLKTALAAPEFVALEAAQNSSAASEDN